jgi:hypothetical protein
MDLEFVSSVSKGERRGVLVVEDTAGRFDRSRDKESEWFSHSLLQYRLPAWQRRRQAAREHWVIKLLSYTRLYMRK